MTVYAKFRLKLRKYSKEEAAEILGLKEFWTQAMDLSGGQRQRLPWVAHRVMQGFSNGRVKSYAKLRVSMRAEIAKSSPYRSNNHLRYRPDRSDVDCYHVSNQEPAGTIGREGARSVAHKKSTEIQSTSLWRLKRRTKNEPARVFLCLVVTVGDDRLTPFEE